MAISDQVQAPEGPAVTAWYALPAEEVATRLDVDPAVGLSAARAAVVLLLAWEAGKLIARWTAAAERTPGPAR